MTQKIIFHVGYPKTATTWLQNHYLKDHSELIYLGKPAPSHEDEFFRVFRYVVLTLYQDYDDEYIREKFQQYLRDVLPDNPTNKPVVVSWEKFVQGTNRFGLNSFYVADRLRRLCPSDQFDVSVLFTVRNQIKAMPSYYSHYVNHGGTFSLTEMLFSNFSTRTPLLQFLQYDKLISYYTETFSPDQVLALPMEGILGEDPDVWHELHRFLGLSEQEDIPEITSASNPNPRYSRPGLWLMKIANYFFVNKFSNSFPLNPVTIAVNVLSYLMFQFEYRRDYFFDRYANKSQFHYREWLRSSLHTSARKVARRVIRTFDKKILHRIGFGKLSLGDDQLKDYLANYYSESNKRLDESQPSDLSKWDYPL